MSFEFRDAVRQDVQLLILLAGGTGAGKTESALRLATGLSGGDLFAVVDTERGRALHKADDYRFKHCPFDGPFTPERYIEAIQAADELGLPVIVVDSGSHEYEGEGGVLDIREAEFERLGRRNEVSASSWIPAKARHKKYRNALLRTRSHVIVCHRAEDKIEIVREGGKTVVRPKQTLTGAEGWVPICERRLPFEATISLLFTADAPGVPKPIKLESRHRALVPLDVPVGEDTGRALALWAAGSSGGTAIAAAFQPLEPTSVEESPQATFPANVVSEDTTDELRFATQRQRRRLFEIKNEHDVPDAQVRAILAQVTGQESTAQIPAAMYDDVIAALGAWRPARVSA